MTDSSSSSTKRRYKQWTTAEIRKARSLQQQGVSNAEIAQRLGRTKTSLQAGLSRHNPGGGPGPGKAQQLAISDNDVRRRGWSMYCDQRRNNCVDWKQIATEVTGTTNGYRAFAERCRRYGRMLADDNEEQ